MNSRSNVPSVAGVAGLNAFLWFIQVLLAIQYVWHGLLFVNPPANMVEAMAGMRLPPAFQKFIGFAEILAGIGLILPGLLRILPWLTPLALLGLTIVMVSATIFHIGRNEIPSAISTTYLLVLVALMGYLRWKVVPIGSRVTRGAN